jgi:hypothetical protein
MPAYAIANLRPLAQLPEDVLIYIERIQTTPPPAQAPLQPWSRGRPEGEVWTGASRRSAPNC